VQLNGKKETVPNYNSLSATEVHERACVQLNGKKETVPNYKGLSATEVRETAGRNASDPRRNKSTVNNFGPNYAHSNCNALSATEVRKHACQLEGKTNRQQPTQTTTTTTTATNHHVAFLFHAPRKSMSGRPACALTATKVHLDGRGLKRNGARMGSLARR
jgi:hypothetical protein